MLPEILGRLALRASDATYDPRHGILDISRELLATEEHAATLPPELASELRELVAEIKLVQPLYASRRETSPLFDREGLGRVGRERAERLARRLAGIAAALQRLERG
jgi:hypothetical protein